MKTYYTMRICCQCGRWSWPGDGVCPGRPCQLIHNGPCYKSLCGCTECNHEPCENCGEGELDEDL